MLRVLPRRRIDKWIEAQPVGSEFTAQDVLDGIWDFRYAPTRIQISSYLRWKEGIERTGYRDSLILWRRVK